MSNLNTGHTFENLMIDEFKNIIYKIDEINQNRAAIFGRSYFKLNDVIIFHNEIYGNQIIRDFDLLEQMFSINKNFNKSKLFIEPENVDQNMKTLSLIIAFVYDIYYDSFHFESNKSTNINPKINILNTKLDDMKIILNSDFIDELKKMIIDVDNYRKNSKEQTESKIIKKIDISQLYGMIFSNINENITYDYIYELIHNTTCILNKIYDNLNISNNIKQITDEMNKIIHEKYFDLENIINTKKKSTTIEIDYVGKAIYENHNSCIYIGEITQTRKECAKKTYIKKLYQLERIVRFYKTILEKSVKGVILIINVNYDYNKILDDYKDLFVVLQEIKQNGYLIVKICDNIVINNNSIISEPINNYILKSFYQIKRELNIKINKMIYDDIEKEINIIDNNLFEHIIEKYATKIYNELFDYIKTEPKNIFNESLEYLTNDFIKNYILKYRNEIIESINKNISNDLIFNTNNIIESHNEPKMKI